jgi:hypothetical protein
VHRKTNQRYWFYEAALAPEAQLDYLDSLKKLSEVELRTFIQGMTLPEAYRPVVAPPYIPPAASTLCTEFRILDYVRTTRKDSRNWWARCPSCAQIGHDRTGDNLAIQIKNPRLYKCWAGCSKQEIRAALGQPIRRKVAV